MAYDDITNDIDISALRRDLLDECLAMAFGGLGAAILDAGEVERASDEELLELAEAHGFDLNKYR